MRLITEARISDGDCEAKLEGSAIVAVVSRRDRDLSQLGLTLAEDRSLMAEIQSALLLQPVARWLSANTHFPDVVRR